MTFGTMIVSTSCILWQTVFYWKCGTLVQYMSSSIPTSSYNIRRFCRMFLSTACRIFFTSLLVMWWNWLARSALFTSQIVYFFFISSTCGMGVGNHLPWCARSYFWKGASYCGRIYYPWSYWILVDVVYEQKIHSYLGCWKSLDGISVPIQVI